jgi:methionyl-tRNA formyltransferase
MKFALFASSHVGLEIARFFGENQEPLACLVVDSKEANGLSSQIIKASGISTEKVFYSDELYQIQTLVTLHEMSLDLIILAWWPYIIKKSVMQIPRIGCLNFHPSYLPYNRGKHYNFWTIVEDTPFGVTLHFVDKGIDSGDIAFQSVIEKSWEDTGETLYNKAQKEIVRLFKEKFPEIKNGRIPRRSQDLSKGSFHKSEELDGASQIILDRSYKGRELLNLLRARTFKPHPAAWFMDQGIKYEVRVEINRVSTSKDEPK